MLLGDAASAKQLLHRALAAPDLCRSALDHLWYLREGDSNALVLAVAETRLGNRLAAEQQLTTLLKSLETLKQAGVERYGVYTLRAAAVALQGDADEAMVALGHAAELGWRGVMQARQDPALASLQSREDFRALLERLERQNQRMSTTASAH